MSSLKILRAGRSGCTVLDSSSWGLVEHPPPRPPIVENRHCELWTHRKWQLHHLIKRSIVTSILEADSKHILEPISWRKHKFIWWSNGNDSFSIHDIKEEYFHVIVTLEADESQILLANYYQSLLCLPTCEWHNPVVWTMADAPYEPESFCKPMSGSKSIVLYGSRLVREEPACSTEVIRGLNTMLMSRKHRFHVFTYLATMHEVHGVTAAVAV